MASIVHKTRFTDSSSCLSACCQLLHVPHVTRAAAIAPCMVTGQLRACGYIHSWRPERYLYLVLLVVTRRAGVEALLTGNHHMKKKWEAKAYGIYHCRFQQVLLLDCDNVPLHDPTVLFSSPQMKQHGNLFWPDIRASYTLLPQAVFQTLGLNSTFMGVSRLCVRTSIAA